MELHKLKILVNHPQWTQFEAHLDYLYKTKSRELINTTDKVKIYQLQGQLKIIEGFQQLKDSLNAS